MFRSSHGLLNVGLSRGTLLTTSSKPLRSYRQSLQKSRRFWKLSAPVPSSLNPTERESGKPIASPYHQELLFGLPVPLGVMMLFQFLSRVMWEGSLRLYIELSLLASRLSSGMGVRLSQVSSLWRR